MTELECMTEYSLVPVGSNTTANVLDYSGNIQWSSLYINDIQHNSSENINITIPEEINWDYTGDDTNFELNIIGYNVDADYIEGVINTQLSKPNIDNFNQIISGLIPLFVPGLIIILFIYFVFRLIKKVF